MNIFLEKTTFLWYQEYKKSIIYDFQIIYERMKDGVFEILLWYSDCSCIMCTEKLQYLDCGVSVLSTSSSSLSSSSSSSSSSLKSRNSHHKGYQNKVVDSPPNILWTWIEGTNCMSACAVCKRQDRLEEKLSNVASYNQELFWCYFEWS